MAPTDTNSRFGMIALWVLRILVAAPFLLAAYMKFIGQPMMVEDFATIGVGQWFRYLTAVLELVGGLAVLVPSISVFGAILLLCVDIGAFFAQAFVLHGDVIHTIVLAVLLLLLIYFQRRRLSAVLTR
jgi:uncharacterized membrane protein YphA (DoxX/SURF4 family)